MSAYDNQAFKSNDASDSPEVVVVTGLSNDPNESVDYNEGDSPTRNSNHHDNRRSSPLLKRRKSSPQMDPIPSYKPTPLHLLHQRKSDEPDEGPVQRSFSSYVDYNPTPIHSGEQADDNYESPPTSPTHEYTPLLQPSRHVISCDSSSPSNSQANSSSVGNSHHTKSTLSAAKPTLARDSNIPRPVSSAMAQAVSRRRKSQADQDRAQLDDKKYVAPSVSTTDAETPVMWSPKLPSEIASSVRDTSKESGKGEAFSKCQSANAPKPRVARNATVVNKANRNRPRLPQGISKKVPQPFRIKYLDVIIDEYLKTGHKEEESYREALKEEQALASRAANRNIYVNLVAGLKKKIREKAGMSTLAQDESQK